MSCGTSSGFTIRRAEVAERDELLSVLNSAFAPEGGPPVNFLRTQAHLFRDERLADHFVRVEDGRIVGGVGVYPFEMRVRGVPFRTAGLGQVGTLREARGRGVMSSILKAVTDTIAAERYDFAWLGGDRLRYGRFGWATGGVTMRFEFSERYLPQPPDETDVRALDWERDLEIIKAHLAGHPDAAVMADVQLRARLFGRGIGGWLLDDSFIVHSRSGDTVQLADGDPERIALLLSHQQRRLKEGAGDAGRIAVECSPAPSTLMQVCLKYYRHVVTRPSGMFRVGGLAAFLEKACRVARPRITSGSGSLSLVNADTQEAAAITCRDGELSVEEGAGQDAYRLNTRELSEVCFGVCPLDMLLPGLPLDSPIRRVLPLPVHWSHFFGV